LARNILKPIKPIVCLALNFKFQAPWLPENPPRFICGFVQQLLSKISPLVMDKLIYK